MKRSKKILLCGIALAVVICIAAGIWIKTKPQEMPHAVGVADLTDIVTMNIGAEMTKLLYADENRVVLQGAFGILVYDLANSCVTDRLTYARLEDNGIKQLCAAVSQDGSVLLLGNLGEDSTQQYDLNMFALSDYDGAAIDLYTPTQIAPGYDAAYEPYLDLQYLIGEYIADLGDAFLYVRAKQDWSMQSLQIVRCSYETADEKVWDVFDKT